MAIELTTADEETLEGIRDALGITPGGGVAEVDAPLTGEDDPRGQVGAFCFDPTTGISSRKMSVSPHLWASWQTTNPDL